VVLMRLQEMARLLSIDTSRVALALVRARIMVRGIGFNLTCARRESRGTLRLKALGAGSVPRREIHREYGCA
jgi:hypothetical protein